MINRKLLTIAIPTYKRYDSLAKILGQIDAQVLKENLSEEIEVLICDDSGEVSDKQGIDILQPYLLKQYVRYIDNGKNIGIINNIIKVIEESSGVFCLSPGDDEELLEDKLVDCVNLLRTLPRNISAVIFDNKMNANSLELDAVETAEKYFWYFGNLGQFIVNTDIVREYIPLNKRNTIWPQTELVFFASLKKNANFFIFKDKIFHSPNHRSNTRYNSYYLLEGGFFSLTKTALNIGDINLQKMAIKNINGRFKHLFLNLIFQYIFNDTKEDTLKTRRALSEYRRLFKTYIFQKNIYCFIFYSKIPKAYYIFLLKILRKYNNVSNSMINKNNKNMHNDLYT
jgi:hypothetical protein